MRYGMLLLAAFASLGTVAFAQHAGHGSGDTAARKPAPQETPGKAPEIRERDGLKALSVAFEGYRPFNPQEPAKGWKAANDEVREAGGHVGMAKGAHGAGHREGGKK